MKKNLERIIEIPKGLEVSIKNNEISIKAKGKEVKRKFDFGKLNISIKDEKIILQAPKATRRESRIIGTIWSHLNNMIKGLTEDFVYELEICNVHFPMNVKVEGDNVIIKSFLGEKKERVADILKGVNVDVKGSTITVKSHDLEAAGQTAANLEKATRLKGRDRRIFQDGIYIKTKCGKAI